VSLFIPMSRTWRRRLALLAGLVLLASVAGAVAFTFWRQGRPYGAAEFSPNGRYYVQKYANWTPRSQWPVGPGQGSDRLSGYVRLFSRSGELLQERFVPHSRDVRPVWSGRTVYLLGVPALENEPWTLPEPGE
jgi:hypothetical protein